MSALEPCPFCGGEALYTPTCHIDVVQCRVCGAQGMAAMGQHEAAIAAWNRRTTPAAHARGCICPPGSEATCKGLTCPRRAIDGRAVA